MTIRLDTLLDDPLRCDFVERKLKQMASAFNYLKCAGFSDADIMEMVSKMLPHIPSDHIARCVAEGGSNE